MNYESLSGAMTSIFSSWLNVLGTAQESGQLSKEAYQQEADALIAEFKAGELAEKERIELEKLGITKEQYEAKKAEQTRILLYSLMAVGGVILLSTLAVAKK